MVVETEDIQARIENRGNIVLVSKYLNKFHVENGLHLFCAVAEGRTKTNK